MTTKYPDLSESIDSLRMQANAAAGRRAELFTKWIERLEKTQKEMRHLERIENFTSALKEKQEDID